MSEDDVAGVGGYDGVEAGWGIGSGRECYAEPGSGRVHSAQGSIAAYYPEANVLVALDQGEIRNTFLQVNASSASGSQKPRSAAPTG